MNYCPDTFCLGCSPIFGEGKSTRSPHTPLPEGAAQSAGAKMGAGSEGAPETGGRARGGAPGSKTSGGRAGARGAGAFWVERAAEGALGVGGGMRSTEPLNACRRSGAVDFGGNERRDKWGRGDWGGGRGAFQWKHDRHGDRRREWPGRDARNEGGAGSAGGRPGWVGTFDTSRPARARRTPSHAERQQRGTCEV